MILSRLKHLTDDKLLWQVLKVSLWFFFFFFCQRRRLTRWIRPLGLSSTAPKGRTSQGTKPWPRRPEWDKEILERACWLIHGGGHHNFINRSGWGFLPELFNWTQKWRESELGKEQISWRLGLGPVYLSSKFSLKLGWIRHWSENSYFHEINKQYGGTFGVETNLRVLNEIIFDIRKPFLLWFSFLPISHLALCSGTVRWNRRDSRVRTCGGELVGNGEAEPKKLGAVESRWRASRRC